MAKYILEDTVCLWDDKNVPLFLRFMRADSDRRWRYLWSLRFSFRAVHHPQTAQLLATTLAVGPAMPDALAVLPSVNHVRLQPGDVTQAMLEHIIWPPLVMVELWKKCTHYPDTDPDEWEIAVGEEEFGWCSAEL
ncbi:hypothetical protein C8Q80DRAFT_1275842 [Daedaleopsis nitida]|nr:hypothetical protein C8Q80DRAFT_1275842 [Daedaleopsis nitida]